MLKNVQFSCNLLMLLLIFNSCERVRVSNVINFRQEQSITQMEQQVTVLQYHQQKEQLERYGQETQQFKILPKQSIYRPMVKFLNSSPKQPPTPQQLRLNDNSLPPSNAIRTSDQHYIAYEYIPQQRLLTLPTSMGQQQLQQQQTYNTYQTKNQQHFTKFQQQQHINQKYEQSQPLTSLSTEQQIVNNHNYLQPNSYQQHQQKQQVFNFASHMRLNQYPYQQQYQLQQPQQIPQLQKQNLQFYKPQMTTTSQQFQIYSHYPNSYYAYNTQQQQQQQQQKTNINFNKQQSTYTEFSSSFRPVAGNKGDLTISPLLPSYSEEEDAPMLLNATQFCQICCVEGQNACKRCCDTRPLLSATILKSSAG